jgi:hypothetical protein
MRSIVRYITLLILIFQQISCNRTANTAEDYIYYNPSIEIDYEVNPITYNLLGIELTDFYDNVDSIKIIPLETNDESLIGTISRVYLINDTIFVADYSKTKSIFVYDNSGRYLYKICKKGQGPGEYQKINMMQMDDSTIQILDYLSWKWIKYDLTGQLLLEKKIGIHPQDFIEQNDGNLLLAYTNYSLKTPYQIVFADSLQEIKNTAFPFKNATGLFASTNISDLQKLANNAILYHYSFCDTIFQIVDNEISPKYTFSFYSDKEIESFLKNTNNLSGGKYFDRLMKANIVQAYEFLELQDVLYVRASRGRKSYVSIVFKDNNKVYTSISGDGEKMMAYNPFIVNGYANNALIAYIDERFFKFSKKNQKMFYSHLKNPSDIQSIQELKDSDNNPVLCVLYLKSKRDE